MLLTYDKIALPNTAYSILVRPQESRSGSAESQILVFFSDHIRELQQITDDRGVKTFRISEQPLQVTGEIHDATSAEYDTISDSVLFVDSDKAIKRLDRDNSISVVAGSEKERGRDDGRGGAARFECIYALAADGKGNIFVADGSRPSRIRLLRVRTGEVVTLRGSEPLLGDEHWLTLSYDAAADVLVAATSFAVCHMLMYGSENSSLGLCAATRLMAGDWVEGGQGPLYGISDEGEKEGFGADVRFSRIIVLMAGAGSRVHVWDGDADGRTSKLLTVAADGTVRTAAAVASIYSGWTYNLTALPGGRLALCTEDHTDGWDEGEDERERNSIITVIRGDGFAPSSEVLASLRPLAQSTDVAGRIAITGLLTAPTSSSNEPLNFVVVTVRVGGGRAFTAHRSVLVLRSEYFQRKLAEDGGFGDSGAAELSLPDADPDAFDWLLSYCYTGALDGIPDELLQPAAELAGRLLLPADCTSQLTARLLAATTPATAIGDLVWAERHGLTGLVSQLKAYLLWHRKEVATGGPGTKEGLTALAALNPGLAAELMMQMMAI